MKKLLFCSIAVAFLLSVVRVKAQETGDLKNDVRLSYGMTTSNEMALATGEILSIIFIAPFDSTYRCDVTGYGSFNVQYQYSVSKLIKVGATFAFNPGNFSIRFDKGSTQYSTNSFISLMPRVDFVYVNRGIFQLYSGLALGATYYHFKNNYSNKPDDSSSGLSFNFHVNGMGVRVGKSIGGFLEFGFGCLGIFNFGVSAKL
jgi:hypothetical protein